MPQSDSTEAMESFHLPDLVALCGDSFEIRTNPHCHNATVASIQWAEAHGLFDEELKDIIPKFQVGLLASLCFPTCDYPQLKLIIDSLLYAVLSGLEPGPAYEDLWLRLRRTTTSAWQADFQFKIRVLRESLSSDPQPDMSLAQWLEFKRHTSGFLLVFTLIEYAGGLDVPEKIRNSAKLQDLTQHAADILVWIDELASYNVRQARDDKGSLVAILSSNAKLTIQDAINAAAAQAKNALTNFLTLEHKFLSDRAEPNEAARRYVQGLRDWVIGFAHWIYETDAYFLGHGEDVKAFGWVFILPKSEVDPIERWMFEMKESSTDT